jgi:hypothetical protein
MATAIDAKVDLVAGTGADAFAKLSVGTNGQVLTAASGETTGLQWATPVTGSITLLSTTSLSGLSTTVSSISQSYTHLYVTITGVTFDSPTNPFRVAPNGVTNLTSGFSASSAGTAGTTTVNLRYAASGNQDMATANTNCFLEFTIYNYTNAAQKVIVGSGAFQGVGSPTNMASITSSSFNSTSAITSLLFDINGSTMSTGTVTIYGVN